MSPRERFEYLDQKVKSLPFSLNKVDLAKMMLNVKYDLVALDRESVICRQKKRTTSHYESIEESINTALDTVEEYLTMAVLLAR